MSEEEPESTIRGRELGEALREALKQANLSGRAIAKKLRWPQSQVPKLLNGQRIADEVDIAAFLALCEVTGAERDRLLALARELGEPGWLQQYGSRLPKQLRTLIDHENKATTIKQYEGLVVPGLLQTDDYAREMLLRTASIPKEEVQDRVAARLARQSLFSADRRPDFTFFVHEQVLRLPVGSPSIMSDQLHHLLRMSVRSYVSVRIIPISFGAHAGTAGACRLMDFAGKIPSVAYLEGETMGLFLETTAEIKTYRKIFEALADAALDEGHSRDLIGNLATALYADREDHDDHG
ncbi:MAG TPA: helix-turn-helix transcriptional regulator [Pseudonocardiaceae bacterium]|nr:helix-turn-helix transcriptional regulator [Pseudonocardiaceae bacterium]